MKRSTQSILFSTVLLFSTIIISASAQNLTDATKNENVTSLVNPDFGSVRISASIGVSRRLPAVSDKLASDEKKLIEGVKNGLDISGSISYVGKKNIGFGLLIDSWSSSTSGNLAVPVEKGFIQTKTKIDDKMLFVGPGFFMRFIEKSISFNMLLALGYHSYTSNIVSTYQNLSIPVVMEGSTAGLGLDASLDFMLSKNFHFGLGVNILTGGLSEAKQTAGGTTKTVKLTEKESLLRMGINAGFRVTI